MEAIKRFTWFCDTLPEGELTLFQRHEIPGFLKAARAPRNGSIMSGPLDDLHVNKNGWRINGKTSTRQLRVNRHCIWS